MNNDRDRSTPTAGERDEIDAAAEGGREPGEVSRDNAEEQDFAARNVIMSNALPGGASPAAGAIIGSGGDLGMEPEAAADELPAEGRADAGPAGTEFPAD